MTHQQPPRWRSHQSLPARHYTALQRPCTPPPGLSWSSMRPPVVLLIPPCEPLFPSFLPSLTDHDHSTKVPRTTIYTGLLSLPSLSTETLLSYGDLYKSGDLASTPTCPPTGCSGTFTTTLSGTQRTMITSGMSLVSTICPTVSTMALLSPPVNTSAARLAT